MKLFNMNFIINYSYLVKILPNGKRKWQWVGLESPSKRDNDRAQNKANLAPESPLSAARCVRQPHGTQDSRVEQDDAPKLTKLLHELLTLAMTKKP